ncbi:toluene-4-monooxygenase system B family protein [Pseudonocardia sp. NPDC049635]|uniref:toluene-4-monooxygenase system B family protein n=1 Tax=Pseudonocardia sp. NPDC049635 TaxID=3155506 RepID=UPI0033CD486B
MTAAEEPRRVPLNAIFAEDFVQILVPVMSTSTVAEVAQAVAAHVEGRRVRRQDREKVVFHDGRRLDPDLTVTEAGIEPLDHVRIEYDTASDGTEVAS